VVSSSNRFVLALLLAPLGLAGCGLSSDATTDDLKAKPKSTSTKTKVFLVPTTEAARTTCRDQINQFYCTNTSADVAAAACVAALGVDDAAECGADGSGCLRYETVAETCTGTAPVYPTAASCKAPRHNNCSFYSACVETNIPCDEDGYSLGFGEKYCTGFKNASFSPKGDAWMVSVMYCLQKALVPYTMAAHASTSCADLQDFAFNSHPACYTKPGNSICFLPPSDVLTVLDVVGLNELFSARTLKQMAGVVKTCSRQLANELFGGGSSQMPRPPGAESESTSEGAALSRDELMERYQLWQELDRRSIQE
jgi:hypothetical protein